MGRLLPLVLALAIAVVPSVTAQTFDLASGSAYGLRVDAEYKLGPQDTAGHEAGAWGAGSAAGVGGAPYAMSGRDWVFTAVDPLSAPLQLDPAGMVRVSAWMGGGDGEFGQHEVGWELMAGETVLATGEPQELVFVMEILELTWEVAPVVTTILPEMGDLSLRVFTSGTGVGVRINLGETPGWTQITLPILAGSVDPQSSTSTSAASNSSSSSTSSETSTGPTSSSTTTLRDDSTPTLSESTSPSSSTGGNATDDGSKESPAPPLVLAGLVVLVAAIAARRRLR
jgi:hypothetical protein